MQALCINDSLLENNFKICIPPETYTQHINDWKGTSVGSTKKQGSLQLKKIAQNWCNGRRAFVLATQVFPQLIQQSIQYCKEFSYHLFSRDKEKAHDFYLLCQAAIIQPNKQSKLPCCVIEQVLCCLLSSNVKLNNRSAETPLICHNSLSKHRLSGVFYQYLPENYRQFDKFENYINGMNNLQKIFEVWALALWDFCLFFWREKLLSGFQQNSKKYTTQIMSKDLYNKRLVEFQDKYSKKALATFARKKNKVYTIKHVSCTDNKFGFFVFEKEEIHLYKQHRYCWQNLVIPEKTEFLPYTNTFCC
ncbi:hypothetical protein RFI_04365 [Reticulomyxa filosa]|uniref:Uncharacterized protein n=1 Tax=Reticulomyxa filosa TaxID=46433 RepID=X6P2G5_RETFI|nr:hypothetical protein RFI_04365 [Reticulomyxa filosa]|eukprot:ETO32750.1 hypothetical protein RFI_04365 [Reticulomyxa filosa]